MRQLYLVVLFLLPLQTITKTTDDLWLTVFIHGTFGIRSQLKLCTFRRILQDKLSLTPYKKIVHQIRNDPYFFKIQPIQDLGLQPIKSCRKKCSAASLFAAVYDANSIVSDGTKNLYYTYGWSGLLSHLERQKDAGKLYEALTHEVAKVQRSHPGATIHLRLIGYSHGGSVALHLAQQYQEEKPITVDELILLATPIQQETDRLIHHPLFLKVYNFYSKKDLIQAFDCFSQHNLFSRRDFKKKCLDDKLVQVEIKVLDRKYPESCHFHINRSPNHTEWWFFGWTLSSYRKEFITYPLPLAAYIPNIIEMINDTVPQENHIKITLNPDGGATLKAKKHGCNYHAQWIDPERLEELKQYALQHEPESTCIKEQKAHINCARKSTPAGLHKLHKKHTKQCRKKSGCFCICGAGVGTHDLP